MVRILHYCQITENYAYAEFAGLASDDKPVGYITGSKFTEVDTGKEYLYDEESGVWTAINAGNGKTSIVGATVTLGSALTYNGSEQTKSVSSVVIGTSTLVANTDYEVLDNKGTEVGDYVLYIVGKGSYTGIIAKAWSIGKETGSVSASPDELSLTAGGDAGSSTLTITGNGAITAESSDEDVATASVSGTTVTVVPVAEGSATITVSLEGNQHYSGASDNIAVTVAAADGES